MKSPVMDLSRRGSGTEVRYNFSECYCGGTRKSLPV